MLYNWFKEKRLMLLSFSLIIISVIISFLCLNEFNKEIVCNLSVEYSSNGEEYLDSYLQESIDLLSKIGEHIAYDKNIDSLDELREDIEKNYSDKIYHLSYGMIDLPTGKMKSREGTVVDADDLIEEMREKAKEKTLELGKSFDEKFYDMIGLGALKFFLLKVNSQKRMMFDPNKSINFQGDTASFVQYTFVRIQSVLRKNDKIETSFDCSVALENVERKVIFEILEYHNKILEAAETCDPSVIAQYVLSLARSFSKMYEKISILKEEDVKKKNLRLTICKIASYVIKDSMKLLGIEVPDQM